MTVRRGVALACAVVLAATLGCQTVGRTIDAPVASPPLAEMSLPPSFLTPRSQHYRLAVRDFVDQTGSAKGPAHSAGEVLVTALHAGDRFELYDMRGRAPVAALDDGVESVTVIAAEPGDEYRSLQGVVDGVLESYVTAVRKDAKGNGRIEVDYRVVDPYTGGVVSSGNARVGLSGGALVRKDVSKLADALSRGFVSPDSLAEHGLEVREVKLDDKVVQLTLSGGSAQQIRRGFVGFVYQEDLHARVERYLAKFVVVNVFPEAAVGVVVDHCNAVDRCAEGQEVAAVEQARSIHVGSRVRFK
jgi:hypothetical protein